MKYWLVSLILEGATRFSNFSAEYLIGIYASEEEANEAIHSNQMNDKVKRVIEESGLDDEEISDRRFYVFECDFSKHEVIQISYDCWDS